MNERLPEVRFNKTKGTWRQKQLKEVLNVNSGRDYKHLDKGNIPVYGTGGYMLSVNDKLSEEDAVGIGRKGTINKPQYLKAPFWTVDTLFYMTPTKNVDLNYIYSLSIKINWKRLDESTGVPSLSKKNIEKLTQYFPDYGEQVKIGRFFKHLDETIDLNQHALSLLKKKKKAFLQKMFPKKGELIPEVSFSSNKSWEVHSLGEIMDVTSVKRIHQKDWTTSGIRFLRARDIVSMHKNKTIEEPLFISEKKYEEYSSISGKVAPGDLLVTGVGTIGIPLQIENNQPIYFKDGNIIWFKNNNKIDGNFLYYSFNNHLIQSYIKRSAGVGTVGTYTIKSGKSTPLLLPKTREEQQMIGNFFKELDNSITLQEEKLDSLKQMKKAFLQKMFV